MGRKEAQRRRNTSHGRRAVQGLSVLLVLMVVVAVTPQRSEALLRSTLKKTTNTVDKTVDTVVKTVDGTVETVGETVDDTAETLGETIAETLGETIDGLTGTVNELTGWYYTEAETTLEHVAEVIGADALHKLGYTGKGVDIALIDTGVVPVEGLASGNVVNGPDLSFESQVADARYLDTFGHGTHMAGIIAGRDSVGPQSGGGRFQGIAPDARLVSLKLASFDGATDVSQVVAAIDWVVAHRNRDGMNIRVLNLSFGTDGVQDYRLDPLTHAVQNAWRHGIVVVVSAGNAGFGAPQLNNPAYDPYVIAVGAGDTHATTTTLDDTVPAFSSRGNESRRPDVIAPGQSIVSLRDPGSYLDTMHPGARVGERFFKGSGTSQAAAVVSGAVALLLERHPHLTPDQVKQLLTTTASPTPAADAEGAGAGMINVNQAALAPVLPASQRWEPSTGLGSLDAARGSNSVADEGVELSGEQHILGPWDAATWARASAAGDAWNGGAWHGAQWSGDCWCGSSWTSLAWAAHDWSGQSWAGVDWAGRTWRGDDWSGRTWRGDGWAGRTWRGDGWSGLGWSGAP